MLQKINIYDYYVLRENGVLLLLFNKRN